MQKIWWRNWISIGIFVAISLVVKTSLILKSTVRLANSDVRTRYSHQPIFSLMEWETVRNTIHEASEQCSTRERSPPTFPPKISYHQTGPKERAERVGHGGRFQRVVGMSGPLVFLRNFSKIFVLLDLCCRFITRKCLFYFGARSFSNCSFL